MKRYVLLFLVLSLSLNAMEKQIISQKPEWHQRCLECQNESMNDTLYKTPILYKVQFNSLVNNLLAVSKEQLNDKNKWLNGKTPNNDFFDHEKDPFLPYIQKIEVKPETKIAIHGDLHGDVVSLHNFLEYLHTKKYFDLNTYTITDPNFKMLFLGDYVDKGKMGLETIATITVLKIKNPKSVFLLRGNHEDPLTTKKYGFNKELEKKIFDDSASLIARIYNYLPLGLYLKSGNNAFLCCHGGIEVGFDKSQSDQLLDSTDPLKNVLLGNIHRSKNKECIPEKDLSNLINLSYPIKNFIPSLMATKPEIYEGLADRFPGYIINDYQFNAQDITTLSSRGIGLCIGKSLSDAALKYYSTEKCALQGTFRAHQHDGTTIPVILNEQGIAHLWKPAGNTKTLWPGIVCTFCVAPNNEYGKHYNFDYSSFGILKTAEKFDDWELQPIQLNSNGTIKLDIASSEKSTAPLVNRQPDELTRLYKKPSIFSLSCLLKPTVLVPIIGTTALAAFLYYYKGHQKIPLLFNKIYARPKTV